jgi:type IV pilus assembly protein PilQ
MNLAWADTLGPFEALPTADLQTHFFRIQYAKATDLAQLLKNKEHSLLSKVGSIGVDERTNTLVVQETAAHLQEIGTWITQLDFPLQQVLIESHVVVAQEAFEEALGIEWGNVSLQKREPSIGMMLVKLPDNLMLDLELLALESEGLGKIIASPRLMTAHQQKAFIESGEEIPYHDINAKGKVTTQFKKAVLRLEVVPQITPDKQLILDITLRQDTRGAPEKVPLGPPAINTQAIQTRVLVKNGQTVVLGGIYQENKHQIIKRIPVLGHIPFLGRLFQSRWTENQRSELIVFVTPRIIE